jgi:hypothetical protein
VGAPRSLCAESLGGSSDIRLGGSMPVSGCRFTLTSAVFVFLSAPGALAQNQPWSGTELMATRRDSVRTVDQPPQILRGILQVAGRFQQDGADSAQIRRAELRLVAIGPAIPATARQRALVAIGLVATNGECLYVSLPAPRGGQLEAGLTGADGSGFAYDLRSRVVRLTQNPSRLCLAFAAPAQEVTGATLYLRRRAFAITLEPPR